MICESISAPIRSRPKRFMAGILAISVSFALLTPAIAAEMSLSQLQAAIKQQGLSWVAGDTSVSGLSLEEKRRLCGFRPEKEKLPILPARIKAPLRTFPSALDWRDNPTGVNWMTPVRNQGSCGSCVAFAVLGALEACENIHVFGAPRPSYDLSEQFLFSCGGGDCDDGWYFIGAGGAMDFLKTTGVTDEACYPYCSSDGYDYPCNGSCTDWADRLVTISEYTVIGGGALPSDDALKACIEVQPVTCAMDVYLSLYNYKGGVYQHLDGESLVGGHGVVIVGWDDTTNPPCWLCKNSWGTGWGESGYFKIKRGDSNIGVSSVFINYDAAPSPPPPPPVRAVTPAGVSLLVACFLAATLAVYLRKVVAR